MKQRKLCALLLTACFLTACGNSAKTSDVIETPLETTTATTTTSEETTTEETTTETADGLQLTIEEVGQIVVEAYGENFIESPVDEERLNNDTNRDVGIIQVVTFLEQGDWTTTEEMWLAVCTIIEMDTSSELYSTLEVGQHIDITRTDTGDAVPFTITAINEQYVLCAYEHYWVSEDSAPILHEEEPYDYEGLNRVTDAFNEMGN